MEECHNNDVDRANLIISLRGNVNKSKVFKINCLKFDLAPPLIH